MMPTTSARCRPARPTSGESVASLEARLEGVGTPEEDAALLETGVSRRLAEGLEFRAIHVRLPGRVDTDGDALLRAALDSRKLEQHCAHRRDSSGFRHRFNRALHGPWHARATALLDRESLRLDGEVSREGLVDLILDRADEARRHGAVHHDDRQANRQRDGSRRGAERVCEERICREPTAGRQDSPQRQRKPADDGQDEEGCGDGHPREHRHCHDDPAVGGDPAGLALAPRTRTGPNQRPGRNKARATASRRFEALPRACALPSTARIHRPGPGRSRARTLRAASRRCR